MPAAASRRAPSATGPPILVSDGEDHGGGLGDAVATLAGAGVVVHALGVGTPEGAPVPIPGRPGEVRGARTARW